MAYPGIALVAMVGVGLGLALWYFLTDTTNEPPHGSGPPPRRDTPPPNNSWETPNARRRHPRSNSNTNSRTTDDCPICTEPMDGNAVTVKCGHIFHIACIKKWREAQSGENRGIVVTCPLCRQAI